MKRFLVILLVTLSTNIFAKDLLNQPFPNIVLFDLNGKLINLEKQKHKGLILISFSATYCKPCKIEIGEFEKIAKEYSEEKIKIYLVFVDKSIDDIKKYVEENKISLQILHDIYQVYMKKYEVTGLPTSFLIKDGKIIEIFKGFTEENIVKIKKYLK